MRRTVNIFNKLLERRDSYMCQLCVNDKVMTYIEQNLDTCRLVCLQTLRGEEHEHCR